MIKALFEYKHNICFKDSDNNHEYKSYTFFKMVNGIYMLGHFLL